jgi:transposase
MAFDTDEATVYQVRPRHRHQEVQEVVPRNYRGVMGTDRGRSYEDHSFRQVKQQKCVAHLQRTLSEVLDRKKGRARELADRTRELLRLAGELWEEYHWGSRVKSHQWAPEVRWALPYHLRDRPLKARTTRSCCGCCAATISGETCCVSWSNRKWSRRTTEWSGCCGQR